MRPTTCNVSQAIEIALYTQSQLDAAVEAEREECAKLCDSLVSTLAKKGEIRRCVVYISDEIRARGKHDA